MNAFRHLTSCARRKTVPAGGRNPANQIMLVAFVLFAGTSSLSGAHAAELGRLFYTPQQRAQLDAGQTSPDNPESGTRSSITVNGVIQKQGGKRTVWINGKQQPADYGNEKSPCHRARHRAGQIAARATQGRAEAAAEHATAEHHGRR